MNKIVVFIVLCCALAFGCKTKKSHVEKSFLDSTQVKREQNNLDLLAISAKVTNTSATVDSSWANALRLTNFSGTIYTSGKVEGTADQADIQQSGNKKQQSDQTSASQDSITIAATDETQEEINVKSKEYSRQNEVKGIAVPWWVWLIGIIACILLGYWIVKRIKSTLRPF